jgi:hypothetical protein
MKPYQQTNLPRIVLEPFAEYFREVAALRENDSPNPAVANLLAWFNDQEPEVKRLVLGLPLPGMSVEEAKKVCEQIRPHVWQRDLIRPAHRPQRHDE